MLSFRPVEKAHVRPLAALQVADNQVDLVSPNAITMAQAPFEPGALVRGIWDSDRPVGLIAMIDTRQIPASESVEWSRDQAYLWRLMVAGAEQGKGIGNAAIAEAKRTAHAWGLKALNLTTANDPRSAQPFYERHGFVLTGRQFDGELEMVCQAL